MTFLSNGIMNKKQQKIISLQRRRSSISSNDSISDMTIGHNNISRRNSITSSINTSKYTSGLTATSTFSSFMDEHHSDASTSNSSAIEFTNNSVEEFDIIDTLDYEDIDNGLIDHENVHRSRETLINNLLTSEEAYTESLELVMRLFLLPLRKDTTAHTPFNFLGIKKMVCTEREFRWLFGNFEELVHVHRLTLKSLQERLRIWGPTQILSDVFQAWFPNLECYRVYLNNYAITLTTYERLTRYQPFKKFIATAHKDKSLKGASLLSLIQLPVRCIDRYVDVITKLAEVTSSLHPDYVGLQASKSWIQHFRHSIHDKLLDANNVDQVLMIHQALQGAPFSVRAERRLIIQGQLSRVVPSTKSLGEERRYILFSDMLVFAKTKVEGKVIKLQYKGHLTLERARVRAIPKDEIDGILNCIEIVSSFSGVDNLNTTFIAGPTVYILHMNSDKERNSWLTKLEYVIDKLDKYAAAKHGM
ncbi:Dbl homology domain-containing protein [Cokeromyces recurvatus]|uniref:Dbl homology domain-containing protein n=1 Tax=Cokeromyces recurvatus TaxID=90255 RepID=UPI00221F6E8B|nr:Dbl homology domain-containing protein [Cokeromyces recurvatus]KAI7898499.1 Dbl homology domain-containing protein [Cokeromyces recurvatus]